MGGAEWLKEWLGEEAPVAEGVDGANEVIDGLGVAEGLGEVEGVTVQVWDVDRTGVGAADAEWLGDGLIVAECVADMVGESEGAPEDVLVTV